MKIKAGNVNISRLVEKITWSGDINQLARKFSFSYLYSRNKEFPKVNIEVGEIIKAYVGNRIFQGVVIKVSRTENSELINVDAVDMAWYLNKIKVVGTYAGRPQDIVSQICSEYGIPTGHITGSSFSTEIISTGDKTIYQVIRTAYDDVGYPTAYIRMDGTTLNMDGAGTDLTATLSPKAEIQNAQYSSSIENMYNKVLILDKDNKLLGEVTNDGDLKYGLMQECYKSSEDEDAYAEAGKLLQSVENDGNITCTGNFSCITGKAVYVKKVNSNIKGRFTIISDSHSIADAEHNMTLGLKFEEVS